MNKTHGLFHHPLWKLHRRMIDRCHDPKDKAYPRYGGRGIYVEESWHSLEQFIKDMGEKPEGMSLERIDNNGPYSKNNCKWATNKEQCRNKRTNRMIELNGVSKTLVEWSEITGINRGTIANRLDRYGYSVEKALTPGWRARNAG
jgi:hypothetical protein